MDILKSVIKCGDCSRVLEKPVTLPCGSSICLKHLESLQNRTYLCKLCDEDHHIEESNMIVSKALERLINSNVENLNLGCDYNDAFDFCNGLDQSLKNLEAWTNEPMSFIKQTIDKLKNKTELIREERKLKIDEEAKKIIEQLETYLEQCKNNLDSSDLQTKLDEINHDIINTKEKLVEWQTKLNDFSLDEQEWKWIKEYSNKYNYSIKQKSWYLKRELLKKIDDSIFLVLNFKDMKFNSDER